VHHSQMTHDSALVVLSYAVALLASYTALDMGTRLRRAAGKARRLWLTGSSVVLGGGIWSMHFVGMLAMNVGMPVGYDFGLTALSLLAAIVFVAIGFHLVTRAKPTISIQIFAGCVVGFGVVIMHYTGMGALVLAGTIHYDRLLVAASVMVALIAATAALWLTLNLTRPWERVAAAAIMAFAVCGMHYTAMAATSITMLPGEMVTVDPLSKSILAAAVSASMFLILCLAMVCVFIDRRLEFLAEREAGNLRAANMRLRGEIEERQAIARDLLATNAELTETQRAVSNLLNNVDQGFLTLSPDLLVGNQCSAACKAILGTNPAGKPIIDLLYAPNPEGEEPAMRGTLISIFRDSNDFTRSLKVELLPTAFHIGGKSVQASYKWLPDSGRIMVILTDVTQTALLTATVERERERLEMIVLAVTEEEAFTTLINDYHQFITADLPQLIEQIEQPWIPDKIFRSLHTFKGLLAQFKFSRSPRCLHEIETTLSSNKTWTVEKAIDVLQPEVLMGEFRRDLDGVTSALGTEFINGGTRFTLSQCQLQQMEELARKTLAGDAGKTGWRRCASWRNVSLAFGCLDVKSILSLHSRGASALASRLQKELAPIRIEGDDAKLASEQYGDFFRALVHVFRNAVDHGIETPDERVQANKPAAGTITCEIREHADWLEVSIADDGKGVDRALLEGALLAAGHDRMQIIAMSLEDLLFHERLSSRLVANEISGRGVGLGAVRTELGKLGGAASVETELGVGTRFIFHLPITSVAPVRNAAA
jgi:NO-binding membrane sensor protein with MHYT domain/signal transduction histidine kinase